MIRYDGKVMTVEEFKNLKDSEPNPPELATETYGKESVVGTLVLSLLLAMAVTCAVLSIIYS